MNMSQTSYLGYIFFETLVHWGSGMLADNLAYTVCGAFAEQDPERSDAVATGRARVARTEHSGCIVMAQGWR
jgi:hypothetical protein